MDHIFFIMAAGFQSGQGQKGFRGTGIPAFPGIWSLELIDYPEGWLSSYMFYEASRRPMNDEAGYW